MAKKETKNTTKGNVKKETKNTTKEKKEENMKKKTTPKAKETTPKKTIPKKTTPKKKKAAPTKKEAVKKETPKKETPKKAAPKKKKETTAIPQEKQFVSMCGANFNADPSSTCFLMCKEENPNDFQNCLSNYEELQKAKPAKKKLNRRKKKIDYFGDGVGTSASMINALLVCGASMNEIQEELEIKKSRVTGHFGGLKTQGIKTRPKPFAIFRCKETNRYYFDEPDLPFYGHCDDCGNTASQ